MARHSTIRSRPSFKTGALNHSATLPVKLDQALSRVCCKKKIECWTQSGFQFPKITFEMLPMTPAASVSALVFRLA